MSSHQEYKIAGHSVLFPCKPYPSQFSMMDRIIKGIERHQNCLLESPTGSGKSLALLCSALAWQAAEKKKQQEEKQNVKEGKSEICQCYCHSHRPDANPQVPSTSAPSTTTASATATAACTPGPSTSAMAVPSTSDSEKFMALPGAEESAIVITDDDDDEDFRPLKKFREPGKSAVSTKKKMKLSIEYEESPPPSPSPSTSAASSSSAAAQQSKSWQTPTTSGVVSPCSQCNCEKGKQKGAPQKVPKIYFGTRTHKQVAQIVRELRKTAYHDVPMTILASREHTCMHPQVSCASNKNEGCENLLKDAGCRFKDRVMKYQSQNAVRSMGLHSAWDLEDLVEHLKKRKACPYFVSRGLKDQSDLIICPYNYLVDPIIRDSMEINLKGQIILLDEAHNIEDSVREAASQSITQEKIQKALHDMDVLMEKGVKVADISKLRQMCHRLDIFIEDQSTSLTQHDFDQAYRMWSGFEIIAQLQRLDLGLDKCKELTATINSIKAAETEERLVSEGQDPDRLSSATWSLLEQIFLVLKYLYKDDMKHAEDYRASIVKSIQYVSTNLNGSWMNSRRNFGGRKTPVEVFTLNFWCMNPAVGFADFACCRSVILTSGTLSPMDSFQSELGQPFPILLEANHIIKDSQVWVGAVGKGPDGKSLHAVYRNMETFEFQDSLGKLIHSVCTKIPKGVLCFLPSYKTLEKLTNRWKTTGLWSQLEEQKRVLCEPRGSDKVDFELIIRQYYNIINSAEEHGDGAGSVDGALFFAVCRGKVSEGMDFTDNFARAVITVGIPYPNFKDIQVELKRKYNDRYQSSRRLLSGHLWYEIQAFRALNQALGRCIRHRKDWGALIIVDDRFVKNTNKYANGLSKWVRQRLRVHQECSSMLASLSDFTKTRLEADQQNDSLNSSQLPSTPLTPASNTVGCVFSPPPPTSLPYAHSPPSDTRIPLNDVSNVAKPVSSTSQAMPSTVAKTQTHQTLSKEGSLGKQQSRDVVLTPQASELSSGTQNDITQGHSVPQTSKSAAYASKVSYDPPGAPKQERVSDQKTESAAKSCDVVTKTSTATGGINSDTASKTVTVSSLATASGAHTVNLNINGLQNMVSSLKVVNQVSQSPATSAPPSQVPASMVQIAAPGRQLWSRIPAVTPPMRLIAPKSISGGPTRMQSDGVTTVVRTVQPASNTGVRSLLANSSLPLCGRAPNPRSLTTSSSLVGAPNIRQAPAKSAGTRAAVRSLLASSPFCGPAGLQHNSAVLPSQTGAGAATVRQVVSKSSGAADVRGFGFGPNPTFVGTAATPTATMPPVACNTSMMFVPVSDPSVKPTLMMIPFTGPTQTLLNLPPQFRKATGMELLVVPPGIQHIILARTLSEANVLFQGYQLQSQNASSANAAPSQALSSAAARTASQSITTSQKLGSQFVSSAQSVQSNAGAGQKIVYVGPKGIQSQSPSSVTSAEKRGQKEVKSSVLAGASPRQKSAAETLPLKQPAKVHVSPRTSVQQGRAAGKNDSQTSNCSSPSLFGDSPVQDKATLPTELHSGSAPTGVRIPSPTGVAIHSGGKICTTAPENVNSPIVLSPSSKPLTQSKSCASTSTSAAVPTLRGNTARDTSKTEGGTWPRGSSKMPSDSKTWTHVPKHQDSELPNTSVKRVLRKKLFRNTPSKSGASAKNQTASAVSATGVPSLDNRQTTPDKPDELGEKTVSAAVEVTPTPGQERERAECDEEEKVERRVRGSKRLSLSLTSHHSKKRRSDDLLNNIQQEAAESVKCAHCGFLLLGDIKESDFERRENMPTCLKGMADPGRPEVLYFRGTTVTERLTLPASAFGDCRRQQSFGELEASVQLIRCPGCQSQGGTVAPGAADLLGAKVTLTDPAAASSTGQMWIFTHMVTLTPKKGP